MSCCNSCGLAIDLVCLSNVTGVLTTTVDGLNATIKIQVIGGGRYRYHLWFTDTEDSETVTLNPPSSDSIADWEGDTDENGIAEIVIKNENASTTWYPKLILDKITVGSSFSLGV